MAYDARRGVTVLFGGDVGGSDFGETWEWDGNEWTLRNPVTHPPARHYHAMAYDARRGVTVLFGGLNGNYLSDTWEWDGETWTQRLPTSSPPARCAHAMAYDYARGVTMLFGGAYSDYQYGYALNDTWEWNGAGWAHRTSMVEPPARSYHAMAYDSARSTVVLFGGSVNSSLKLADTWEWNGACWTERTIGGSNPRARFGHSLAYDSVRGVTVMFGGSSGSGAGLGDTWEWNGTFWALASSTGAGPQGRSFQASAYDSGRSVTVMFGGNRYFGDTWEWNGTDWEQRSAIAPKVSSCHSMSYDSARGVTVVFGGRYVDGTIHYTNETWEWNGTAWFKLAPITSPPAREGAAMVFDTRRGVIVLFGGYNDGGPLNYLSDTWEWDGANWTEVDSTTTPPAREFHAMSYDAVRGVTTMFGGLNCDGSNYHYFSDTWEWDGTNWTLRSTETNPPESWAHAMAFDRDRGVTVLFGGRIGNGPLSLSDTWEWNGNTWSQLTAQTRPPGRGGHAMIFDEVRGQVMVFGGSNGLGVTFNDTWDWDGANWRRHQPPSGPPRRDFSAMAYDSARSLTVLFGGGGFSDTWELGSCGVDFEEQPSSPSVCAGGSLSIRTVASANGPIAYQWQKDGVDIVDTPNRFGSETNTLVFTRVETIDAATYACSAKLVNCARQFSRSARLNVYTTDTADGNADQLVDARDISTFIDCLTNSLPVSESLCAYDLTSDGIVNLDDLPPFVARLVGS